MVSQVHKICDEQFLTYYYDIQVIQCERRSRQIAQNEVVHRIASERRASMIAVFVDDSVYSIYSTFFTTFPSIDAILALWSCGRIMLR